MILQNTTVLQQDVFGIKGLMKVDMPLNKKNFKIKLTFSMESCKV